MISRIFDYIVKSPAVKALIFAVSTIGSSLLAGVFIYEITLSGSVSWKSFYRTKSFYAILIWVLIIYVYNHLLYKKEIDILKFRDDGYCKAYIRSQCLPEIAARYRDTVRRGDTGELKDIAVEIKRIMK